MWSIFGKSNRNAEYPIGQRGDTQNPTGIEQVEITRKRSAAFAKRYVKLYREYPPKHSIGDIVEVQVFDYGSVGASSWTWLDECRKVKIGLKGQVIERDDMLYDDHPKSVSPWSYRVRFEDKDTITFMEENLKATKL